MRTLEDRQVEPGLSFTANSLAAAEWICMIDDAAADAAAHLTSSFFSAWVTVPLKLAFCTLIVVGATPGAQPRSSPTFSFHYLKVIAMGVPISSFGELKL